MPDYTTRKILALPPTLVMKCLLNPRNVLVTDLVRNVREMGSSTYEVVFIMKRFGGTRDIRFILNVVEKEKGRRLVYLFEGAEKTVIRIEWIITPINVGGGTMITASSKLKSKGMFSIKGKEVKKLIDGVLIRGIPLCSKLTMRYMEVI